MSALPIPPGSPLPPGAPDAPCLNALSAEHHMFLESLGMPVSAWATLDELRVLLVQAQAAVEAAAHPLLTPLGLGMLAQMRARLPA